MRFRGMLGCGLAIVWLGGLSVGRANEVTVKNDSFTSGGSAVVVGGFVPGEEAGARLTATCTGNIVALQVGWLADPSTGEVSLEAAIKVYADNVPTTFPTPGPQLLFLEGPVLTEGAINEFRFVDEQNTIPISIPINQGDSFFVTLQFDSSPNPVNGDPSVFRDTNGCKAQRNVIHANTGQWLNLCSFTSGDFVIRAVIDCQAATGACCLPNGQCQSKTAAECASMGGTYQGNNVSCGQVSCPQPTGACCISTTGGCLNGQTQANCNGIPGGMWQGAGTNCGLVNCNPEGACCLPDGSCQDALSPTECQNLGGNYQGDNSMCANVDCPDPVGACCFDTGFCLPLTDADCTIAAGHWAGAGTDCTDADGSGVADDCENGPPCPGDADGDGDSDLDDLLLVLGSFGCGGGGCAGDVDGDGDTDLDDLLLVLGALGQVCN